VSAIPEWMNGEEVRVGWEDFWSKPRQYSEPNFRKSRNQSLCTSSIHVASSSGMAALTDLKLLSIIELGVECQSWALVLRSNP
jgi:hypothetical protein